jgi:putative hydrolase of HD superfamily
MVEKNKTKNLANFLYEIGTLRKLIRAHRQTLLTDDLSDSISSHSFRVTWIGWFLAKEEGVDPYKVLMFCLLHDIEEARSGDHNWVHKRYVKVFDDEIREEQLTGLPQESELQALATEYHKRETKESKIAKDADMIDQMLLLKEYEWQGIKEASEWLTDDNNITLSSETARKVAKEILSTRPSEWTEGLATSKNR